MKRIVKISTKSVSSLTMAEVELAEICNSPFAVLQHSQQLEMTVTTPITKR